MRLQRMLGLCFVAVGAVLLGVYLVPTIYGSAMSHLAVAQFRMQNSANRLWDSARVRAYQHTLEISFSPPEAVLRVPKADIEVPVLEGTSELNLNRGVGHVPGTALPGQAGNIAIAGHRDGFFRGLKDLVPGDVIELQRPAEPGKPSQEDRYVVKNIKIVFPTDTSVLNNTTDSTLTLITCYPFYFVGSAPQRYVVQASLVPQAPVSQAPAPHTPSAAADASTISVPTQSGE
jgi:sortase A